MMTRFLLFHQTQDTTFARSGKTDDAIKLLEVLTENGHTDSISLAVLTNVLLRANRNEEALRAAEAAVAADADLGMAHASLGWVLLARGTNDLALDSFRRATTLDPDNIDYRAGRGVALVALQRYREAMSDFAFVRAHSPGYF
jgi:Flp pilus assembly protein TadD